ncbi:MAG: DUF6285 domain-containing protein [Gammaproteobacteria bacterium]
MRDAPDVDELLGAARDSLLANILPAVAAAQKREVLMIANAVAIARRSLAAGDAPLVAELAVLRELYPLAADDETQGLDLNAALAALNARLVRDIRRGAFDAPGAARSAVEALLKESVVQKLRENRPKLVDAGA